MESHRFTVPYSSRCTFDRTVMNSGWLSCLAPDASVRVSPYDVRELGMHNSQVAYDVFNGRMLDVQMLIVD